MPLATAQQATTVMPLVSAMPARIAMPTPNATQLHIEMPQVTTTLLDTVKAPVSVITAHTATVMQLYSAMLPGMLRNAKQSNAKQRNAKQRNAKQLHNMTLPATAKLRLIAFTEKKSMNDGLSGMQSAKRSGLSRLRDKQSARRGRTGMRQGQQGLRPMSAN